MHGQTLDLQPIQWLYLVSVCVLHRISVDGTHHWPGRSHMPCPPPRFSVLLFLFSTQIMLFKNTKFAYLYRKHHNKLAEANRGNV
ncbi:hypothetical protein DL89DRAFT_104616 [Linderina pennispora]|uniref:Uncharacterized protein n=1 Tax=Linderina pennispora TaxID=61395 RepID=A0A1Y1WEJ8_9FUNG|nr:uncharacterized protein DL89DRAFT_104616 [Linderina pennispora]ORX71949.1 hypothetical protein DL89DRAFT_104616 [Linderina pennispora]